MKKIQKMRMFFRNLLTKFGEVITDKGKLVWDGNEDLREGMQVFVENPEAEDLEYEVANAGNYTTEDGKIITVGAEGIVESIEDPKAEVAEETPAEPTAEEMAEETPEVENPTNTKEETDTEAIVELRREVNELYARIDKMEEILRKLSETPAAMAAVEQVNPTPENAESVGKQRLAYLRK